MTTYKLTYFDLRARAENTRMMFELAGQKYEDVRLSNEEWLKFKPNTPFGQLPILEVDGKTICQSRTIERLIAKKLGLYGNTDMEQAKADMIIDYLIDMGQPLTELFFAPEDKKAELRQKYVEEKAPPFLENINKMVNSDGYFIGKKLSWPDIAYYNAAMFTKDIGIDLSSKSSQYTKLQAVVDNVQKNPKIAAWIARRPKSAF